LGEVGGGFMGFLQRGKGKDESEGDDFSLRERNPGKRLF